MFDGNTFGLAALVLSPVASLGEEEPQVVLGNGADNWIVVEGMTREGREFRFPEVKLAGPGWLVLHPFRDGKPLGEIYVGARYLAAGTHRDVRISVRTAPEPTSGTNFVVMLHHDVNDDGTFDFVFVDERNVADKAVFEGNTMIAHVIAAP